MKVFSLPVLLGCETANHANFMLHFILIMLVLALQGVILDKCQKY